METIDHRVVRPDGEIRWLEWTDRALFDGQDNIIELQSIGRDISEKKDAEETLHQSEDRYRSLVEIIPNGFFICAISSGDILRINQKACDLLGYTMQEMLTRSIWEMITPDEQEKFKDQIQTQTQEEISKLPREVYTMLHKEGSTFRVELSSSLINFQGQLVLQGLFWEQV